MPTFIVVCTNYRRNPKQPSCAARGSEELREALVQAVHAAGLPVEVESIACFGRCQDGPVVRIAPGGPFILNAGIERVEEILAAVEAEIEL